MQTPKLTPNTKKATWFKQVVPDALIVAANRIYEQQFSNWLSNRLQQNQIKIDSSALWLFCSFVQGNVVAAMQEIEKLKINNIKKLSEDVVQQQIIDNAKFSSFNLSDQCLDGNLTEALRIYQHLKAEKRNIIEVFFSLQLDIQTLYKICQDRNNIQWSAHRVWYSKQKIMQKALHRHSNQAIEQLHLLAKVIENNAKGLLLQFDPWQLLKTLIVCTTNANRERELQFIFKQCHNHLY